MNELDAIVGNAKEAFIQAATPADLENAKAVFLGKAGRITELMKSLARLPVDEKKIRGAAINIAKQPWARAGMRWRWRSWTPSCVLKRWM